MHKHYTQNTPVGDVKALERGKTYKTLPDTLKTPNIDAIAVINWLIVIFAYAWWAVVVVYFGLLAETATLPLQMVSFPVIIAALALARLFQMAMHKQAYGFASLFFSGLLVAGMLA